MKLISRALFVVGLAALACQLSLAPAVAQNLPTKIAVDYLAPKSKLYLPMVERLKSFRLLEQLAEFLSPLRLPHAFSLVMMECGFVNAQYQPSLWRIEICYEFVDSLERMAPKQGQSSDTSFEEVVVGGLAAVLLHESGHAVFDMFDVPVFGREEDAADEMSTFLALQFNKELMRFVIKGIEYNYRMEAPAAPLYSDEHGTALQRYYNILCMASGGAADVFKDILAKGELPKERAAGCVGEYEQVKRAFIKTVLPFIDQDAMKKVQAKQWLTLTPQQSAALKQQQVRDPTFDFAACNTGNQTNLSIAIIAKTREDPQNWRVYGWFAIPNGGCNYIGSFAGDTIYWYGMGANNVVWSAPDTDRTAKKQCIDRAKSFEEVAGTKCPAGQALVNFRLRELVPPATGATLRLN